MLKQKIGAVKFHHIFVPGWNGWTTIHINQCDFQRLLAMADENELLLNKVFKIGAAQVVAEGIKLERQFGTQVRNKTELLLATTSDPYLLIGFLPLPDSQVRQVE